MEKNHFLNFLKFDVYFYSFELFFYCIIFFNQKIINFTIIILKNKYNIILYFLYFEYFLKKFLSLIDDIDCKSQFDILTQQTIKNMSVIVVQNKF